MSPKQLEPKVENLWPRLLIGYDGFQVHLQLSWSFLQYSDLYIGLRFQAPNCFTHVIRSRSCVFLNITSGFIAILLGLFKLLLVSSLCPLIFLGGGVSLRLSLYVMSPVFRYEIVSREHLSFCLGVGNRTLLVFHILCGFCNVTCKCGFLS